VPRAGREIEFRSRCLDDGRKSKSHFNIYLFITITTYLSLYLRCDLTKSGLGTVKVGFMPVFVSGTVAIST
jgi:hypothetical protein